MDQSLPPVLEKKLADFRRRVWTVKLAEAMFAAIFGLVLSYLLVFALDRVCETPGWMRLTLLCAGAAGFAVGVPLKWHRWVWRQRRLEDAARLLRRTFPRLGDQLLGIVELARHDQPAASRSERLVRAAIDQAADAVRDKDFTHAVPQACHRRWGWVAALTAAVALAGFVVVNEAARNALARWFMPLGNIDRYTFAQVETLPDRLVVPYAEPFSLSVRLTRATVWSPVDGYGRLAGQSWTHASRTDGTYPLAFPPQKNDASLSVWLGDVRKTVNMQPRSRPELEEMTVRLKLPAYLQYRTQPSLVVRSGSVSVLKGSEASFEARASRPLAAAETDDEMQTVDGARIVTGFAPVNVDAVKKFTWRDTDGLAPREPLVLKIHAVEDEAPKIVVLRDSIEQVVLDSEVLTFDVKAWDDFGVRQAGLSWTGSRTEADGKTPIRGEKLAAAGAPEQKEMATRATFCATREGVAPQTIELRAWTDDYLPGRPHAYSTGFVLQILNKTDHALWVTEQFGRWLEAARETYEREQRLHETNKELRALSPEELERPENRRRVAQQAANENANAARLGNLNDAGRKLVEQATRNDEFDAQRLESWATMLRSLKDIATNRMPGVSDLLKQTANAAPAGKSLAGGPSSPTNPSQSRTDAPPTPPGAEQNGTVPPSKSGPSLAQGNNPPPTSPPQGAPTDPNATPKPPAPGLSDREVGLGKPPETKPPDPDSPPKPPGAGSLNLPHTTLDAVASNKNPEDESSQRPESPAQQSMENALTQQRDLLAEFAKVTDQLNDILGSLEASTFVKRLKAASKKQMQMASHISTQTLDAFGVGHDTAQAAVPIARQAREQSEIVRVLQNDLDAYSQRKSDAHFKKVLGEMRKTEIVRELERDGDKITTNLTGEGMIGSEYWADILDRWAEEMVGASNCKSSSSRDSDSLPPEIVLKMMQTLRDEMQLRDETREMEKAKPGLESEKYAARTQGLTDKQADIGKRVDGAADDIRGLPEGAEKFEKELKLLTAVSGVMAEAHDLLAAPATGAPTVAAETEAIELLLQSKRNSPKGGGGGGSTAGGGGTAGNATPAALADLGPGADVQSTVASRPVGQATGHAGKEFPAEFKGGLDAYFNLLERQGTRR